MNSYPNTDERISTSASATPLGCADSQAPQPKASVPEEHSKRPRASTGVLAIVILLLCGISALLFFTTTRLTVERNEQVAILVAKKQIDNGAVIKVPQDWFEEKLFVKGRRLQMLDGEHGPEEPRDALSKLDDLKGRIMKRILRVGEFIREEDMRPEGYRAVNARVNLERDASVVASWPNSRVDIIQTVRRGDAKTSYAKIILENVLVLAACTSVNGNAMPATIVVLALSPEDEITLLLAREVGPLSLALPKISDIRRVYRPLGLVPIP